MATAKDRSSIARIESDEVVQERLGHSQISVTMDTYSHVLPTMQKAAAAKLEGVFDRAKSAPEEKKAAG